MCEVDPLTIREGVHDHELKGRLRCCSFGETLTVIPEDSPREKEGPQRIPKKRARSIRKCFSRK
jgi:hypothetical protein